MTQNQQRVTYDKIKSEVLNVYFNFCRDHGLVLRRSHEQTLGAVDNNFENVFKRPIEKLMLCVAQLILSGGWYSYAEEHGRKMVVEHIALYGLENLLVDIASDEKEQFLHDLRLLKLLE